MSSLFVSEVVKAIEFIEAHIREPISVKSVCEQARYSRWEFQRVFRAQVGDSIGGYIRGRRLTLAAHELVESKSKIVDLALDFQFSSQESFSRAIKDYFGYTPGQIRENQLRLSSLAKPELNMDRLLKITSSITREPEVGSVSNLKLVGTEIEFPSTLGTEQSSYEKVKSNWIEFFQQRDQISFAIPGKSYGVISAEDSDFNKENLHYLCCTEVTQLSEAPKGMKSLELEEQSYAIFEVAGDSQHCHVIADYVYGIWLPQSKLQRAQGFDLEVFDHSKFRFGDPNSVMHYCVPVIG